MRASRIYTAEGIILKRKNIGETDRIVTVFTRQYGKLRLLAKGVRRVTSRRAPHLEIFTKVNMVIHQGKTLDAVSEVTPIEVFGPIRGDLRRVSIAYFLCELVDSMLAEKQEHEDVYALLSQAFGEIAKSEGATLYRTSKSFALELLWALGFLPRNKKLHGEALQAFIEDIAERRLKTPRFARSLVAKGVK